MAKARIVTAEPEVVLTLTLTEAAVLTALLNYSNDRTGHVSEVWRTLDEALGAATPPVVTVSCNGTMLRAEVHHV